MNTPLMTNDIAISVSQLSKCYQIYEKPHRRLLQGFLGSKKQYYQEFWALNEVSFNIKKGETVGIIGRNGSGKSTLLQLICGTLSPTKGSVETFGRLGALLELGSGFNPEFTGHENVLLNAAVLGLSEAEINARYDAIIAFADIGKFIEQPVKTYSSGMLVRLAFAVQVNVEPDILIVDEALSVGDFFFQQKCFAKLRQLQAQGVTLLFVSHDMGSVRNLCASALYLKQGRLQFSGDSLTAIRRYLAEDTQLAANTGAALPANTKTLASLQQNAWWRADDNQNRALLAVRLLNSTGEAITQARVAETVTLQVYFRPEQFGHVTLLLKNRYDQVVSSVGSYSLGLEPCAMDSAITLFELSLTLMLEAGQYSLMVVYGYATGANTGQRLDETPWIGPLHITWDYATERAPFLGMFGLPAEAQFLALN